jgi:hypothetical protein
MRISSIRPKKSCGPYSWSSTTDTLPVAPDAESKQPPWQSYRHSRRARSGRAPEARIKIHLVPHYGPNTTRNCTEHQLLLLLHVKQC